VHLSISQTPDQLNIGRTSAQWSVASSLLLATVVRIGLVVISYGCKVPCGIFVPSMAIGATFGRMVGIMVKALQQYVNSCIWGCVFTNICRFRANQTSGIFAVCQPDVPCITPGTYAFLGAAAALRSVPLEFRTASADCLVLSQWCHAYHSNCCGYYV
jgi:chloride channel 3/4/5